MEILSASSAVTAVSFLSWPQKRISSKMVSTMYNLKFRSIKRNASNKVKVEKSSWVSSVGGASVCTLMTSLIWGLTEKAAIALEPIGRFDAEGPVNDVAAFLDKYPFFAFGVSFVVFFVVPLLGDQVDKSNKWATAEEAYSKLRDEKESQLVDIRTVDEINDIGSPDVSSFNKEVVQVTYDGDDIAFLGEMLNRFKEPDNATLYILDMYDGKSMQVAQMLTRNGFKTAYAIRDGFQGSNGWQAVEEKLFTNSTQVVARDGATVSPNPKINASASSTVKQESLQDKSTESRTMPSSMDPEVRTNLVPLGAPVMPDKKVDVTTPVPSSLDRDVGVNSASQTAPVEVSSQAPSLPRALSPYPQYPDLKPPTSPTPSKPTGMALDSATNNGPVISDQIVDGSARITKSAIETPCFSRPLSPYAQYPDLKPPTSPTPSKPSLGKAIDAATGRIPLVLDQNVDELAPAIKSAPIAPAFEASCHYKTLSPYSVYPDLKPPTSPTPSRP
ncbi:protein THYLAKOID RHODANESE-LIKE, chloroplastic isoform X2 [Cryptomeria japonica]|uniref:protein THYLAKOID RHODANESE-LIKE, chloroplastic isoform X2 n=1 Tax=Cryptomeria japonica TaxID=3369 RepID=UPI0027DA7257|nr:protein THYLAKOID RHODANESE-LIKE, chloroplastic isoform X2 [Cryptomeria japonica]